MKNLEKPPISRRSLSIDVEGLGRTKACFYVVDSRGSILFFNSAMEALFGYAPEEYLGNPISMLATDPENAHRRVSQALDTGMGSWQGELVSRSRDGRVFPCQITATRFFDRESGEYLTLGLVRDMSDYARTLENLKSRNDRLGALASLAARMGIYTDTHRLAREALQAAADLVHVTTGSILLLSRRRGGMEVHETLNLPPDFFKPHRARGWENMLEGQVLRDRVPILIPDIMKDGRVIHILDPSTVLENRRVQSLAMIPLMSQERPVGIMTLATEHPRVLEPQDMEFLVALGSLIGTYLESAGLVLQLEEKNLALEKQNTDLEELLSIVSHDLRSPLATIGGYASLLMKRGDSLTVEEQQQFASTIFRKTRETSQRMEDLLSFFRSSLRSIEQKPTLVDVGSIVEQALEEAAPPATRELFRVEIPDNLPLLLGYPHQLTHLFSNLFSNSFKFIGDQKNPLIRLEYERLEEGDHVNHRFTFSDNGIGIPAEYLSGIFRPFVRGPVDRSIPGSGIGLAVVERVVRSHGGTIEVSSQPGEGTTFTFTLPWDEASEKSNKGGHYE